MLALSPVFLNDLDCVWFPSRVMKKSKDAKSFGDNREEKKKDETFAGGITRLCVAW